MHHITSFKSKLHTYSVNVLFVMLLSSILSIFGYCYVCYQLLNRMQMEPSIGLICAFALVFPKLYIPYGYPHIIPLAFACDILIIFSHDSYLIYLSINLIGGIIVTIVVFIFFRK